VQSLRFSGRGKEWLVIQSVLSRGDIHSVIVHSVLYQGDIHSQIIHSVTHPVSHSLVSHSLSLWGLSSPGTNSLYVAPDNSRVNTCFQSSCESTTTGKQGRSKEQRYADSDNDKDSDADREAKFVKDIPSAWKHGL